MPDLAFPAGIANPVVREPACDQRQSSPPASVWHTAQPESVKLGEDEVHLWTWELRASDDEQQQLFCLLSEDERQRHDCFRFVRDRVAYRIARGTLRRILGAYLSLSPADVRFTYSPFGKPSLEREGRSTWLPNLEFNLSHTRTMAIVAISRTIKVGVDLEELRPVDLGVARQVFSATEQQELDSLPAEQRLKAFYHCWTRKEAIVKAEGMGLNIDVASFSVTLNPSESARVLEEGSVLSRAWLLVDVPEIYGSIGALATSRRVSRIRPFHLTVSLR